MNTSKSNEISTWWITTSNGYCKSFLLSFDDACRKADKWAVECSKRSADCNLVTSSETVRVHSNAYRADEAEYKVSRTRNPSEPKCCFGDHNWVEIMNDGYNTLSECDNCGLHFSSNYNVKTNEDVECYS